MAPLVEELHSHKADGLPLDLAERLVVAWGNEDWAASPEYIAAAADHARATDHPVIECGSGLSTVVLSIYASGPVWSLEHHRGWASAVSELTTHFGLAATVVHAPLTSYGAFDWYRLPLGLPSVAGLVVCDGPPGTSRGGRYGALPVLRDHLAPGALILVDDVAREGERKVLRHWVLEHGVEIRSETATARRPFAVVEYAGNTRHRRVSSS